MSREYSPEHPFKEGAHIKRLAYTGNEGEAAVGAKKVFLQEWRLQDDDICRELRLLRAKSDENKTFARGDNAYSNDTEFSVSIEIFEEACC
jgi:hypothetical protein